MIDTEFERRMRNHAPKHYADNPAVRGGGMRAAMFTKEVLDDLFTYHAPKPGQLERYAAIRQAARQFADVIVTNTTGGPDQSAAIRELRLCVMTANASIALEK